MRKFLLPVFLLLGNLTYCQSGDTTNKEKNTLLNTDSIVSALQEKRDSLTRAMLNADSNRRQQEINNNMNYILRLQKENKDKQRKAAMARIAIGAALLVVLIIGLRRRRKR